MKKHPEIIYLSCVIFFLKNLFIKIINICHLRNYSIKEKDNEIRNNIDKFFLKIDIYK